jgi:hypothetical protein
MLAPILFSMGYGCFLPRARYAAFFEHKIQEKHIPRGMFCSGSLATAPPKTAATDESALAAPSASITIRSLNPRAGKLSRQRPYNGAYGPIINYAFIKR